MRDIGTRILDVGFGRPRGLFGRLGGWIMARGNAATELYVVDQAALGPDDEVLVIGPGPGVGLRAAGARSRMAIGVDPSEIMRATARRRCADLVAQGRVRVEPGTAERTGRSDASVDVVITVNNVHIWSDRAAGFAEIQRVLRPGGRLLLSVHRRWSAGGEAGLAAEVAAAGLSEIETWTWEPPGLGGRTAVQLRALCPTE